MTHLRVAQLTRDWSPNGGVAAYVRSLVDAQRGAGHEVMVIHGDGAVAGGPTIAGVGGFADHLAPRSATTRVLDMLDSFAPDVVHVHSCNNFDLERAVRRRHPTVKTLHVFDFCPTNTRFHHLNGQLCTHSTSWLCVPRMGYKRCLLDKRPAVMWRLYRRAVEANRHNRSYSTLVVASEFVRRQSVAAGYPADRVRAIPYFTPVPPACPPPPAGAGTVLFSSRVVREKGLHVLLRALAAVARPWRLLVAGDGVDRQQAEATARRLGLGDRVSFLGWLGRGAVARCHAEATVVAVPSLWPEPFGIVGLEAMAHARPVVAFAVGGIPEWLDDGETGFLVAPGDIGAMADRLTRLLDDRNLAASLGARGRARVERDFSAAGHLERLLAIYTEITTGRVRSGSGAGGS